MKKLLLTLAICGGVSVAYAAPKLVATQAKSTAESKYINPLVTITNNTQDFVSVAQHNARGYEATVEKGETKTIEMYASWNNIVSLKPTTNWVSAYIIDNKVGSSIYSYVEFVGTPDGLGEGAPTTNATISCTTPLGAAQNNISLNNGKVVYCNIKKPISLIMN